MMILMLILRIQIILLTTTTTNNEDDNHNNYDDNNTRALNMVWAIRGAPAQSSALASRLSEPGSSGS